MPSISSFAEITRRVIARNGFDQHLPTVLYPARKYVLVLEGAPPTEDLEAVALDWARSNAVGDEESLLAFKVSATQFKVIQRQGASLDAEVFVA
jgi:hypothetical protein